MEKESGDGLWSYSGICWGIIREIENIVDRTQKDTEDMRYSDRRFINQIGQMEQNL